MKTSEWIILGVVAYLWYQSKNPGSFVVQPSTSLGPPVPTNDPCNSQSVMFDPVWCQNQGRTIYTQ